MNKKLICVSDTHRQHHNLKIDKCDLFIFSGDAEITSDFYLDDFKNWINSIDATYKCIVFGNHDTEQLGKEFLKDYFKKEGIIYLENESVIVNGIKVFGSPFSKMFYDWAFMAYDDKLADYWQLIDNDTDIVVTHGPAWGWLDQNRHGQHCGSESLKKRLLEVKPKYHVTGHIHEQSGFLKTEHTTIVNAAMLDENYELVNGPKYFDYLD